MTSVYKILKINTAQIKSAFLFDVGHIIIHRVWFLGRITLAIWRQSTSSCRTKHGVSEQKNKCSTQNRNIAQQTLAPIWFPHWPA